MRGGETWRIGVEGRREPQRSGGGLSYNLTIILRTSAVLFSRATIVSRRPSPDRRATCPPRFPSTLSLHVVHDRPDPEVIDRGRESKADPRLLAERHRDLE